jgi:non-ribosomal peptide synthetase component F
MVRRLGSECCRVCLAHRALFSRTLLEALGQDLNDRQLSEFSFGTANRSVATVFQFCHQASALDLKVLLNLHLAVLHGTKSSIT